MRPRGRRPRRSPAGTAARPHGAPRARRRGTRCPSGPPSTRNAASSCRSRSSRTMNQMLMPLVARFMATIGHTPISALNSHQHQPGHQVEHPEPQHPRLQQRDDQQRRARPAEQVEPVVGEPGHGVRLLPCRHGSGAHGAVSKPAGTRWSRVPSGVRPMAFGTRRNVGTRRWPPARLPALSLIFLGMKHQQVVTGLEPALRVDRRGLSLLDGLDLGLDDSSSASRP